MKVSEKMSRAVHVASPDDTIQHAASAMAQNDIGALAVGKNDRLVGLVTDRDIAVRAVAQGKGLDTPVGDVMTPNVKYCFEDDEIEEVARNMGDQQVRRMPVLNHEKRLVGILSLGDIAMGEGAQPAGDALSGISRPGGSGSQTGGSGAS